MKFGAHIYLWARRWADDGVDLLDRAKRLGLDFLEIAWGDDVIFTPRLTSQRAREIGIELVLSPGALWPMECDVSLADRSDPPRGLQWHKRAIDVAAEIGAVAYTGAIYAHPGRVERRKPAEDELRRIAEHLHSLAEYAAARDVHLVLEPMSHFRTHLMNRPDQITRLIAMAEHSNLFALLDTYHMITEVRDYPSAMRAAASRLWGIHASENDRSVPGGGIIPWQAVAQALKEIKFDGYVGMESYYSHPNDDFAAARGVFSNPCPDGDVFVRDGLRFLKKLLR